MTSQGSPYQRFRRALATGNPLLIRTAAAELPRIGVAQAAAMLLVIARVEPEKYEKAAIRWLAKPYYVPSTSGEPPRVTARADVADDEAAAERALRQYAVEQGGRLEDYGENVRNEMREEVQRILRAAFEPTAGN